MRANITQSQLRVGFAVAFTDILHPRHVIRTNTLSLGNGYAKLPILSCERAHNDARDMTRLILHLGAKRLFPGPQRKHRASVGWP